MFWCSGLVRQVPSCISGKGELSIDGVPNVKNVTIYSMARLNFTGSDSVSMVINHTGCSYSTNPFCPQPYFNLGNVRVSRLSSFSRDPARLASRRTNSMPPTTRFVI